MRLYTLWIPRSKIIWSNWELISRFRCLLESWIPRFDFFKVIWEVQSSKCFKIHAQHSLWFLKRYKNCLSGNCFPLGCKYFVKQFPACCFILKNGNSWRKEQLISSKKVQIKIVFFVIWEFMISRISHHYIQRNQSRDTWTQNKEPTRIGRPIAILSEKYLILYWCGAVYENRISTQRNSYFTSTVQPMSSGSLPVWIP